MDADLVEIESPKKRPQASSNDDVTLSVPLALNIVALVTFQVDAASQWRAILCSVK